MSSGSKKSERFVSSAARPVNSAFRHPMFYSAIRTLLYSQKKKKVNIPPQIKRRWIESKTALSAPNLRGFSFCVSCIILTSRVKLLQTEKFHCKWEDEPPNIGIDALSPVFYLGLNTGRRAKEASKAGFTPTRKINNLSATHPALGVLGFAVENSPITATACIVQ